MTPPDVLKIEDYRLHDSGLISAPDSGTSLASAIGMNEQAEALKLRCKQFAMDVIALTNALPRTDVTLVIGRQLLRAATGAAANYRAACRSRSRVEFISRMAVCLEEADEAGFWLELLTDLPPHSSPSSRKALSEANQLSAIFARSRLRAIAALKREREQRRNRQHESQRRDDR